eukprot:3243509-Pleurochrysis_carterae.AAC.1
MLKTPNAPLGAPCAHARSKTVRGRGCFELEHRSSTQPLKQRTPCSARSNNTSASFASPDAKARAPHLGLDIERGDEGVDCHRRDQRRVGGRQQDSAQTASLRRWAGLQRRALRFVDRLNAAVAAPVAARARAHCDLVCSLVHAVCMHAVYALAERGAAAAAQRRRRV